MATKKKKTTNKTKHDPWYYEEKARSATTYKSKIRWYSLADKARERLIKESKNARKQYKKGTPYNP